MIFITGGAFQGKADYAREHFAGYRLVEHYERQVREQLLRGEEPMKAARRLAESGEKMVVICDELGCGLVPMDAFDRKYREACGRVSCYLAGQAEQVIRMVCGIPGRIV